MKIKLTIYLWLMIVFCDDIVFAQDVVLDRGFTYNEESLEELEQAIDDVNQLLSLSPNKIQLALIATATNSEEQEDTTIKVYSIQSVAEESTTPAAVPLGCRCVFVNLPVFTSWLINQSTGSGQMELDAAHMLGFMLLHEIGHIVNGHSAVEFSDGQLYQLNIDPSIAKYNEEQADEFASHLIRDISENKVHLMESITALQISIALSNIGWNMQAYRTIEEFGSSLTGSPTVYFDPSYTHPNLAWRFLRANHLIQDSKQTKELLESFEKIRDMGANPRPLYKRSVNE